MTRGHRASGDPDLVIALERVMPSVLPVGRAAALFCIGSCFHRREAIKEVEIVVDGRRCRPSAFGMPRPDLLRKATGEPRSYLSGFWATVPVAGRDRPGLMELELAVRLASGAELAAPLGRVEIVAPEPAPHVRVEGDGLIAICMATFEPDLALFRTQIDSIRSQIDRRWVCLISDDCSDPQHFQQLEEVLAGDDRFAVSRSAERLGFYRNFERALQMVPAEAELVALSDQDDRWNPEKLATLREALGDAQLAYSDQRLVDANGRVLRNTLWKGRRNNSSNLASQLVANTITGAAMLFPRELLEVALPFPEGPGFLFHDHWLGLAAMASGELAFVDRPLYDYVQHSGAIFGDVTHGAQDQSPPSAAVRLRARLRPTRGRLGRWRAAYFYGYLAREVQAQTLLARCPGALTPGKRRVLRRFISCERSPFSLVWLAGRGLRASVGLNETLGSEADLVRGILWKWLTILRVRRASVPKRRVYDATLPDPASFEQERLRRWRARV